MYERVVRFAEVSKERLESVVARIKESDGPPEGVEATGLMVLYDEAQHSAVVVQQFRTRVDMDVAARIFDAMETGETPGTRTSVDACEVVLEMQLTEA